MQAALWRYREVRAAVLEAGELISAEEAERRVLILENPGARGQSCITQTLYAGLQLILPGEVAPAHRHAQIRAAPRPRGRGRLHRGRRRAPTMRRGDFIITPSWTWHDHGNDGREPVVWLDGLDIPLVQSLGVGFAEKAAAGAGVQSELRAQGDALARYGHNLVPMDTPAAPAAPSPLWVYPYGGTRAALDGIARGRPDAHLGHKLRFVNPATGDLADADHGHLSSARCRPASRPALPQHRRHGVRLPRGRRHGRGRWPAARFETNDVFVVPSWQTLRLQARRDCILFSYSDRPVQQALGLWREEKLERA